MNRDDELERNVYLDSEAIAAYNQHPHLQYSESSKSNNIKGTDLSSYPINEDQSLSSKNPNLPHESKKQKKVPIMPLCSWEFWQRFTDITQVEFKDRIVSSLNPLKPIFKIIVEDKIDLYGPFWLCTIFIFCLSVGSNFSELLWEIFISDHSEEKFVYDFKNISWAACGVYGIILLFSF